MYSSEGNNKPLLTNNLYHILDIVDSKNQPAASRRPSRSKPAEAKSISCQATRSTIDDPNFIVEEPDVAVEDNGITLG